MDAGETRPAATFTGRVAAILELSPENRPFTLRRMRGAIAAGHRLTAEAGARVLAEGGNAVDACIAAAFTSWVAESPLTGPGARRLHARPPGARPLRRACSTSSSTIPGLGLAAARARPRWRRSTSTSAPDSTQVFHIGAASVRRPGRRRGPRGGAPRLRAAAVGASCSRRRSSSRATGFELTRPQAYLHAILDVILRHTDEGRAHLRPATARGSSRATRSPARPRGHARAARRATAPASSTAASSAARVVAHVREQRRRAHRRRPARLPRRPAPADRARRTAGTSSSSNPPPSSGGILIALRPALLDRARRGRRAGQRRGDRALAEVMREQTRARAGELRPRPLPRRARARLLDAGGARARRAARIRARQPGAPRAGRRAGRRTSRSSTPPGTPPR